MTQTQYLVGIDLGTSIVKTGIYDLDGNPLSISRREYYIECPQAGWVEQDPSLWWSKTTEAAAEMLSSAGISAGQIAAIGVCGQGHGPTPIAKDGRVLGKCIHWSDRRSTEQVRWIKEHLGPDFGNPRFTAVKILWLKQNCPKVYEETYKFLLPTNYLVFKLTGEFATDYTNASETDMYAPEVGDWSNGLLTTYGISRDKLPRVYDSWEVVGEVSGTAERETGFRAGTPVVAGGGDWACTEYGVGYVLPGRAVDMTGTTFDLAIAGEAPRRMKRGNIIQDIVTIAGEIIETAGATFRWCRDAFYLAESATSAEALSAIYELMNDEADSSEPGLLLVPHFLENPDSEKRGNRGSLFGLTLSTTRGQIARAIMEGLAFEMKRRLWGEGGINVEIEEVRACGGAAGSNVWRQIKADVFGVPWCRTDKDEAGCFGAAVLAGVGVGIYSDLISPIEQMVRTVERNEPRREHQERYAELYRRYYRLSKLLEDSGFYDEYEQAGA